MIVLDTSVLIYAVGSEHPLREPCRRVFAAQESGRIEAAVTVEVIQEFTHARARRFPRLEAVAVARDFATSLLMLQTSAADLDTGLTLFEAHPNLGAFDSILAAVALNQRAEALISADSGFGSVPGLHWVDPASAGLGEVLGRTERRR